MHKHGHPNQQTRPHVVVTNPVHAHPNHHQHPINGGVPPYYPTQQNPYHNPNYFFQPAPQHTHVHNPNNHNNHGHNPNNHHNHGHNAGPTHGHGC